jgi:hypothetical protein
VQELSLSPPGLGRRNDFADLSVNRSKLLLERSQVRVDQCASWVRDLFGSIRRSSSRSTDDRVTRAESSREAVSGDGRGFGRIISAKGARTSVSIPSTCGLPE